MICGYSMVFGNSSDDVYEVNLTNTLNGICVTKASITKQQFNSFKTNNMTILTVAELLNINPESIGWEE